MAPHLASSDPQGETGQERLERCALHPARESTGACNRCGVLFCDECVSDDRPGLCAKCSKEVAAEVKQEQGPSPETVAPQVYRDAALVHLALFTSLVIRPFIGVLFEYRYSFGVVDALPFAGLGLLLFGVQRPLMVLVAVAVDLLMVLDGYWVDDWSRLLFAGVALTLTIMLWMRLPDADAPRFPASPAG